MKKISAAIVVTLAVAGVWLVRAAAGSPPIVLPNGWVLAPPRGAVAVTGTMPQGMAASPDGRTIAVVESGFNPPALSLYRVPDLARIGTIALPGAMGRPAWRDARHVLVAGANADALLDVDVTTPNVERIALGKGSYPVCVAIAPDGTTIAVATDGDGSVRIGTLATLGEAAPIPVGERPGGVAFSLDGKAAYATSRAESQLVRIDRASRGVVRRATGLHPGAVAVDGSRVLVAQSDADSVGAYAAADLRPLATIGVGDPGVPAGVSPDAIDVAGGVAYVALGAANAVAVLRGDRVVGRLDAGWYPTGVLAEGSQLYVLDGKGEGARANPDHLPGKDRGYIGAIEAGSLRSEDLHDGAASTPPGARGWHDGARYPLLRPGGPIRHVFFVLKENRTYDQVLGDLRGGNGDPSLAWFGAKVTPNQHALAERFGIYDNAYTNGEVSAAGHLWTDAGFANEYVERWWPPLYGGRRALDDLTNGDGVRLPRNGYLWDAARRAGVSFRDYGELVAPGLNPNGPWLAASPSLTGRYDPRYAGWNLNYSDLDRAKEWKREFAELSAAGKLPQLEFVWLPNDHTAGAKPGAPTPAAYVALNDQALGEMVETLSHSSAWKSSVMFVTEDDAQDGPDHVSDQRTTLYVISPYARPGVHHEHYSTAGILRTIELLLGIAPLSAYDAMAVPIGDFGKPDVRPYAAIAPKIDVTQRNAKVAYGASQSARLDFSRPDAVAPRILNDILAHDH
ncbi:MAG TPA: bifunctional YncE family protein/alkaline phosphatase family protein [Candidatus Tumulicola sp.]|nr:bifunctional YncE family protein/alkaline phosphatase family protein [Candidatus Tumulicola sp.]